MTKFKFTPGPWHTEINWKPYVAQENGIVLAQAWDNSVISRNEAEANAALIAAAPEMYEHLYFLLDTIKKRFPERGAIIEKLLRKARGEIEVEGDEEWETILDRDASGKSNRKRSPEKGVVK